MELNKIPKSYKISTIRRCINTLAAGGFLAASLDQFGTHPPEQMIYLTVKVPASILQSKKKPKRK